MTGSHRSISKKALLVGGVIVGWLVFALLIVFIEFPLPRGFREWVLAITVGPFFLIFPLAFELLERLAKWLLLGEPLIKPRLPRRSRELR
ncbi:MAG TPA: hypothetical protein VKM94_08115 [Blastocatellia bacterium]|nr:hypothetical protein [Blastocatellia bacterium]